MNIVFALLLLLVSVSDMRCRKIPDKYIIMMLITGVVSIPVFLEITLLSRIAGAVTVSGILFLINMISPGSFGGGDIKLMFASGFYLGWKNNLTAFVIAILLAGMYAAGMVLFRKSNGRTEFALGPFLCAGIFAAMIAGESLLLWFVQ